MKSAPDSSQYSVSSALRSATVNSTSPTRLLARGSDSMIAAVAQPLQWPHQSSAARPQPWLAYSQPTIQFSLPWAKSAFAAGLVSLPSRDGEPAMPFERYGHQ